MDNEIGSDDVSQTNQPQANPPQNIVVGYCTLIDANSWFAARHMTAWADSDVNARNGALLRAADWLDGHYRFRGERCDDAQSRAWPRNDIGNEDGAQIGPLPGPVKQAYLEIALALLEGDGEAEAVLGHSGAIISEQVAGVSVRYAPPRTQSRIAALLAPYLHSQLATRILRQ